MGKVIKRELCKRLNLDHTDKWPVFRTENKIFKILRFDHLIQTIKPDFVVVNKKITSHLVNLSVPVDHRVKIEDSEKLDKYLDLAREMNMNWKSEEELKPSKLQDL